MKNRILGLIAGGFVVTLIAMAIPLLPVRTPPLRVIGPSVIAHSGEISCLQFTPDEKYLVAGCKGIAQRPVLYWEGEIKVIDLATEKVVKTVWQEQHVDSISVSPDGKSLAVALSSQDFGREGFRGFEPKPGIVVIYNFPAMKEVARQTFDCPISKIRHSKNGKMLGVVLKQYEGILPKNLKTSHFNSTDVVILGSSDLEEIRSLRKFPWDSSFAFLNEDKEVVVGSKTKDAKEQKAFGEKVLTTFNLETGQKTNVIGGTKHPVKHIEFNAKEDVMLVVDELSTLLTYPGGTDCTDPEFTRALPKRITFVNACLSKDCRFILQTTKNSGSSSRTSALLWDIRESRVAFNYDSNDAHYSARAFSPTSKQFAIGTTWRGQQPGNILVFAIPQQ